MKGYKGFNKGLICKGKQYAENKKEQPVALVLPFVMYNYHDDV